MNRLGMVMKDFKSKANDFERKAEWLVQQVCHFGQVMQSLKDVNIFQLRSKVPD